MSSNQKKWARAQVRAALGDALADKASKAFCRSYVSGISEKTALPAVDAAPPLVHAVLELVPEEPQLGWSSAELAEALANPGWSRALEGIITAIRARTPNGSMSRAEALLTPKALLRNAFVREMQERCYRAAAPIRDALDRAVSQRNATNPDAARKAVVQYCWLNQTFYTWIDETTLKEIAAHPLIHAVDTSRTLKLLIKETANVVGVVEHRKITQHGGKGVVVAVIDSEVAMLPAVFQDRLVHKRDFTGEGWGHPHHHGTAVAGIIAANGKDAQGMAPDAVIFNYKIEATDSSMTQDDFFGACAIAQALEDGADIANCSWGTGPASDGTSREARACDMAWAAGMTVVHAVGNDGPHGLPQAPADARGVIVVGATGRDNKSVQKYSARGTLKNGKHCPDMVAPGGVDENQTQMQSYLIDGNFGPCGHGTSFAAPHISGMLALLLEGEPGLTPDEQLTALKKLCNKLEFGTSQDYGLGLPSFVKPT